MLNDAQINDAKKRIWSRLQSKLPERGLSVYQPMLSLLRGQKTPISRLKRVQFKERILDVLPERLPVQVFFTKRLWASASLLLILGVVFTPILQVAPSVSASGSNLLEVVEGEVWVNGNPVENRVLLQTGDRVSTGEDAMAHLYFLDDSRVTMGPGTEVDILDTQIDPENRADTQVMLRQESGRLWVQVLNLVSSGSVFTVEFPQGSATVDSRASFDISVDESEGETRLSVARNLIAVNVNTETVSYEGILGQGAGLRAGEEVFTETLSPEVESDVWWSFNLAYGKSYARQLDESYKQENVDRAVILPGNPLYFLKTFRENIQISLTFSSEAKEELLVQQAENRLNEAQVLLAQGETEAAEEVLQVYSKAVEEALENSDNEGLLALVEETQKGALVNQEVDAGSTLLEEHLVSSSALIPSDISEKTEVQMLSASQKLQRLPDLIANGDFNQALADLSAYQTESVSILAQLETVALEEREAVVSTLLDQKLKDIQILRVIASMPDLYLMVDIDAAILDQLSMMVLSLREKELTELSKFFESTTYNVVLQYDEYSRLRDHTTITPELSQQFEDVEQELSSAQDSEVVMDIAPVIAEPEVQQTPLEDPRFTD